MAGPWEKYGQSSGPWAKYAAPTEPVDSAPWYERAAKGALEYAADPMVHKTLFDQSLQGATGGFADEITDRMGAAGANVYARLFEPELATNYDDMLKEARASSKEQLANEQAQHPYLSTASQLGGALMTGKVIGDTKAAKAVGRLLGRGVEAAGQYGKAAELGAKSIQAGAVGSASGAIYGAGQADDGHAQEGAGHGALVGLSAAGLPLAGAAASEVKSAIGDLFKSNPRMVGEALNKLATNPDAVKTALQNIPEYVPNSPVTVAEATGDMGLSQAQRALRNASPADFGDILSQQNAARNQYLDEIAGTPADILAAKKARDLATSPMREAAFAGRVSPVEEVNAFASETGVPFRQALSPNTMLEAGNPVTQFQSKSPVDVLPAHSLIDDILASPKGGSKEVNKAMEIARQAIERGGDDAERLYEARKDIANAISGKYDSPDFRISQAAKQLSMVRDAIDKQIEISAPGYREYMAKFSEMSKPINQMEKLQEVKSAATSTQYDPATGQYYLSQPKFTNHVRSNADDLAKVLSPEQMSRIENVQKDLDRGSWANNPAVKPVGSDTVMNAMQNSRTSSVLRNKVMGSVPYVKDIMANRDEAYRTALAKALADPATARELMMKYTMPGQPASQNALAAMLLGRPLQ